MSRPAPFRQVDVTRALKSAKAAGLPVREYGIDANGKITVKIGEPDQTSAAPSPDNEWDEVLKS